MKPKIVILGKNYSTSLGVIRSLGKAGYDIDLFYITNVKGSSEIAGSSVYVKRTIEFIGSKTSLNDDAIIERIIEEYGTPSAMSTLLFPTDDYSSSLLDRYRDRLKNQFLLPHTTENKAGILTHYMDKSIQSTLAKEAGLETIPEWRIDLDTEVIEIPDDMVYPCFVKPLLSAKGYKKELGSCDNAQQLKKKLIELQNTERKREILVQKCLNISREYSMSGVCLDQEVIIPALIKKLKAAQRERGVCFLGEVIDFSRFQEVYEQLVRLMRSLHYIGMFDIDLMAADGTLYFGEMNLRSSGTGYSIFGAGMNLPALFVKYISDENWQEEIRPINYGMKFFYDKTAWEDYQYSYMTYKQLREYEKSADFSLIMDKEDPNPGNLFLKNMKRRVFKTHLKNSLFRKKKTTVNVNNKGPKIIVLGRNFSTAIGVIRSLGKAGYDIDLVFMTMTKGSSKIAGASKYIHEKKEFVGLHDEEVMTYLRKNYVKGTVLFPTDDYTSCMIDRYRDQLKDEFRMPHTDIDESGILTKYMDKSVQSRLAKEAGLNTIPEWQFDLRDDEIVIPSDMIYPCFVKPLVSATGYKRELGSCDNEAQLKKKLKELKKNDPNRIILVQKYINISQEYSMSGIALDREVLIPALIRKLQVARREQGVTMVGQLIEMSHLGDIEEKLYTLVRSIHYVGIFDLEVIEENGTFYYGELNLRTGGPGYSIYGAGMNLPVMFVKYLTGENWQEEKKSIRYGMTFLNDKTAWDDYQTDFITKQELDSFVSHTDFSLIMDPDDPEPGKLFLAHMKSRIRDKKIRKTVKKLIGKS